MSHDEYLRTDDEQQGMEEAYAEWLKQQEYEAEQAAMPPHKRDGYAERLYDWADMERKRRKEEA